MPTPLTQWRQRWTAAGIPTIPVKGKAAACEAWQLRPTAEQWQEVGHDWPGNIAVVCGGGLAVADGDSPEACRGIEAHLVGLGVDPQNVPTVRTASGFGRHYYLAVSEDAPPGNLALLAPAIGPGELRYGRGAYVVAPSSVIDGRHYVFMLRYPEAIRKQRPIAWRDLYPLIGTAPQATPDLETPPVRLQHRDMPARARTLLRALAVTDRPTRPFMGYDSRSEAEAAAVALLILAGWDYAEIAATFTRFKPGHYREHANPEAYLARTYRRVLSFLADTPTRRILATSWLAAEARAWPGRGGGLDFATYRALVATGWNFDSLTVTASLRWLAEHAAASIEGVRHALKRLQSAELVTRVASWQPTPALRGASYFLHPVPAPSERASQTCDYLSTYCASGGAPSEVWAQGHEGQRASTLGKTSALVYAALTGEGQGVGAVALATGKHRNTVRAALTRLAAWGLAEATPAGWVRGSASLGDVAEAMEAEKLASRRRFSHELDREAWKYHRARVEQDEKDRRAPGAFQPGALSWGSGGRDSTPGATEEAELTQAAYMRGLL